MSAADDAIRRSKESHRWAKEGTMSRPEAWAEKIAIAKMAREQGGFLRQSTRVSRRAAVEEAIAKAKRKDCRWGR